MFWGAENSEALISRAENFCSVGVCKCNALLSLSEFSLEDHVAYSDLIEEYAEDIF